MNVEMASVLKMPMIDVAGECEHHGPYIATVLVHAGQPRPAECAICRQEIIRVEREEASREQVEKLKQVRRAALLDRIELPARMKPLAWDDYHPPNEKSRQFHLLCQQYAAEWHLNDGHTGNIAMVGRTGTGKTHLACMIAKQVALQSRASALYTTVARMSRHIRGSFNKGAEYSQSQAVDRYVALDLLVLDEVGLNLSSTFERAMLDELIDERSMRRAPTIMISNLAINELEKLAERLMDRMSDNGMVMIFDWDSHRGAGS